MCPKGRAYRMAMVKLLIQIPHAIKAKLDALRQQGTTSSGFIRSLLEREFQERDEKTRSKR
ncbi:protein of unknown function [Nitrospira defluvii]|uniref:Ribbon-helix-helix protein CopG domain-containing protein n=1 Tax=Nitrospira defluvii TaxID=330214 RepID=D8P826_9BACT|nr:protein of unknown function [Nitrospira defluvii]